MIIVILKYLFLFITGALLGWVIEIVYRRYFGKAGKWINPGFLSGPYLPLYGFAVCILYNISDLHINFVFKILLFAFVTTFIEYVTGIFFIKYYKTRLWDYRELRFNLQGVIAPIYTVFWTALSLMFYYILYPYFYDKIEDLYAHLEFSLFIGIFYGIIFVDIINSFHIALRIKKVVEAAEEYKETINFDILKIEIKEHLEQLKELRRKPLFLMPFKGEYELKELLKLYMNKIRDK